MQVDSGSNSVVETVSVRPLFEKSALEELNEQIHQTVGFFSGDEIPKDKDPSRIRNLLQACVKYCEEVESDDFVSHVWIPRLERFLQ